MTECQAPELQDRLPDYVAESLSDAERSQVEVHLTTCDACARDVTLLRTVRALRPQPVAMDATRVARIVAGLPKPRAQDGTQGGASDGLVHPPRPMLVRTTADMTAPPSTESLPGPSIRPSAPATTPSRRQRWGGSTLWRIAATVTVMIAGGTSLLVARRDNPTSNEPGVSRVAVAESLPASDMLAESLAVGPAAQTRGTLVSQPDVPVSYGDLGDYTEEELQGMIDRLDQWDGATSTDPLPGIPLVATRGGAL
ncbi:zf-HC2 domain-containing protein [Gemmatimonas aurantiaca]|uniref:zf-HC2 domain-containing protein n=1 Tax=Gemmatimonas aurantiaca TaxID=173480 RepID=UPI00301E2C81